MGNFHTLNADLLRLILFKLILIKFELHKLYKL